MFSCSCFCLAWSTSGAASVDFGSSTGCTSAILKSQQRMYKTTWSLQDINYKLLPASAEEVLSAATSFCAPAGVSSDWPAGVSSAFDSDWTTVLWGSGRSWETSSTGLVVWGSPKSTIPKSAGLLNRQQDSANKNPTNDYIARIRKDSLTGWISWRTASWASAAWRRPSSPTDSALSALLTQKSTH